MIFLGGAQLVKQFNNAQLGISIQKFIDNDLDNPSHLELAKSSSSFSFRLSP